MLKIKSVALVLVSILTMSILGACGFNVEQHEATGGSNTSDAAGTMPAGQEAPEVNGVLKSMDTKGEVVITVAGQDKTYRLSEDATSQIESGEVENGSKVTFTTYSIGDRKQTIDKFKNQ